MNDATLKYQSILRDQLPRLSDQYHVASLGLFGSHVRGTQRPDSDLDVLVKFEKVPSLLQLIGLEDHLSDLLGVKVDLVLGDSLKPWIRPTVLREVVPV